MKKLLAFLLFGWMIPFGLLIVLIAVFGFWEEPYHAAPALPKTDLTLPKEVTLLHNGEVLSLPLEEYLYGVVAGEMPAGFEEEALKAQAVAARTYTVNRARFPNPDHAEANVCSDPTHCKAYLTPAELAQKFKDRPDQLEKIKSVVDATASQIITYQNEPISAVFHSTSSGITENSRDVWGGDLPYLVSVVSEGEEASPRYTETKTFSLEEFQKKINSGTKKVPFSKDSAHWLSPPVRNPSGSVRSMEICGVAFSGTELRSLLGLRSTHFTANVAGEVTITTKGNGHGVGMSQYGANYMAQNGYTYPEILKKYYTGVEIVAAD